MFRGRWYFFLCCCAGFHAGAQPVLNVIAEQPLTAKGGEFSNGFREVSLVANKVARHAVQREHALDESVGAMLGSAAPAASLATESRPVALLETNSAVDSGDTPELHILPPVQDDRDVLADLDGVMQSEEAKRKLAEEIFAGDKQRMLDVEKEELRRIIRQVFA